MSRYIEMTHFPGLSIKLACCWHSGSQLDTCLRIPWGRGGGGQGDVSAAPSYSIHESRQSWINTNCQTVTS